MNGRGWALRGGVRPLALVLAVAGTVLPRPGLAADAVPVQGGAAKSPPASPPAPARPGTPPARAQGNAGPAIAFSAADAARTPPLQPDRPVTVVLRRGQQAFFRVASEAGGAWTVTTRRLGRDTDTLLAAVNERGEAVVEDDDGGEEGLSSRIEVQPGDGARLVRAGTLEDAGGRFEIVLARAEVLPPPDFATTREDAASRPPLEPGRAVRVRLRRDQEAFFRLPDDRADLIAVTRELAQGTDTVLALLDASGRVLAENDDDGRTLASLLPVSQAAEGPLTLRAGLIGGTGTFSVALEREEPLPPPDYPVNLEQARARGPLEPGGTARIRLGRNGQAIFALPEGRPVTVLTRDLDDNADTMLALLDAGGEQLREDDDGGGGLASRLGTAGTPRPAAFVRATLLNGARGSFELVVQDAPAETVAGGFSASLADAARRPTLLLGEAVRGRIEAGGEAFVALPNDGRSAVAMTFDLEGSLDTVLTLLDESGVALDTNDDAEGVASRLAIPAGPRPAFLRVTGLEQGAGAFSLVLVRPAP